MKLQCRYSGIAWSFLCAFLFWAQKCRFALPISFLPKQRVLKLPGESQNNGNFSEKFCVIPVLTDKMVWVAWEGSKGHTDTGILQDFVKFQILPDARFLCVVSGPKVFPKN